MVEREEKENGHEILGIVRIFIDCTSSTSCCTDMAFIPFLCNDKKSIDTQILDSSL